jgi:hypothetical protein
MVSIWPAVKEPCNKQDQINCSSTVFYRELWLLIYPNFKKV